MLKQNLKSWSHPYFPVLTVTLGLHLFKGTLETGQ